MSVAGTTPRGSGGIGIAAGAAQFP